MGFALQKVLIHLSILEDWVFCNCEDLIKVARPVEKENSLTRWGPFLLASIFPHAELHKIYDFLNHQNVVIFDSSQDYFFSTYFFSMLPIIPTISSQLWIEN